MLTHPKDNSVCSKTQRNLTVCISIIGFISSVCAFIYCINHLRDYTIAREKCDYKDLIMCQICTNMSSVITCPIEYTNNYCGLSCDEALAKVSTYLSELLYVVMFIISIFSAFTFVFICLHVLEYKVRTPVFKKNN